MSEITPALTAEQWASYYARTLLQVPRNPFASMALCNAALPDDDPRKITRIMADDLLEAAGRIEGEDHEQKPLADRLARYAEIVAALLPPETP